MTIKKTQNVNLITYLMRKYMCKHMRTHTSPSPPCCSVPHSLDQNKTCFTTPNQYPPLHNHCNKPTTSSILPSKTSRQRLETSRQQTHRIHAPRVVKRWRLMISYLCSPLRICAHTHLYTNTHKQLHTLQCGTGWGYSMTSPWERQTVHMARTGHTRTHHTRTHCGEPMCVLLTVLSRGCAGCPHYLCSLLD